MSQKLRVGIDIGGTFTDLCILGDEGIIAVGKTLTTHAEPAAGVISVLAETLKAHDLDVSNVTSVVHGTTLVTNALIERRGAKTAVLTTEGFRDVLEMAREHRYELFDLDLELPRPLVPRHLRLGVTERILADGSVDTILDVAHVRQCATELAEAGIEAVAVCFLHSHVNDAHERLAAATIREAAPGLRVALSSQINPEIREYERFSTTVANVYVQRIVEEYLADLRTRLQTLGVENDPLIMLSNGGVTAIDIAREFPIRMLESGPAGGALGAVAFGKSGGIPDMMAFDMGGTTAKLCIIEGLRPLITHTFEVDRIYRLRAGSGLPVRAPVIDMIEIGAGGGSIARINSLGLITIGPDSAGSEPGPASYGRGGQQCTVTDADLVLGYLAPDSFMSGSMQLDVQAATSAITDQIADPLGISVAEAAWGIHATVNDNMANAARVHAIERGQNPTTLPLFVSGGNGPLHGPGVAQSLGSPYLIAPPAAGVLSALGFLSAANAIDVVKSSHAELNGVTQESVVALFDQLQAEARELLTASGVPGSQIRYEHSLEMRFIGQGNEIQVQVPDPDPGQGWNTTVHRLFSGEYRRRFGDVAPHRVGVEILSWRIRASGTDPEAKLRFMDEQQPTTEPKSHRNAYFPESNCYVSTPVFDRHRLAPGAQISGPALIEERESTLVLNPNSQCRVMPDRSLHIEFVQGDKK